MSLYRLWPLLAVVFWTGSEDACSSDDHRLKAVLDQVLEQGYPGIAVLMERPNGEVYAAAAGYADLGEQLPLRMDHAFHMASITKTFTAVAVLRLIDEGKLSLDDTMAERLESVVDAIPHASRITVAQLLDHSSGIYPTNNDSDYLNTLIGLRADPYFIWSPEELVALASGERREPPGAPGEGHFYSDTNYVLLGMIVEKASGRPFKTFIRETLLEPLRMRSTWFYSDQLATREPPPAEPVRGYLLATDELRSLIDINPMFEPAPGGNRKEGVLLETTLAAERIDAAAGLITTLPDLHRFASALFRGQLLTARSQAFLLSAGEGMGHEPVDSDRTRALQAIRKPYGVLLYKQGDGPGGVNTLMAYSQASGAIFIGFTNVFGYFDEVDLMMDRVFAEFENGQ